MIFFIQPGRQGRADDGDHRVAEVAGEADRLHHAHVRVLADERAVGIARIVQGDAASVHDIQVNPQAG